MIVISGALVLVALVLLIIGVVGPDLTFVYASIAVSLVSLVFLVIGILQRRGETAPATDATAAQVPAPAQDPGDPVTTVIPSQEARRSRPAEEPAPVADTAGEELELGGTVLIVEGRPRYHVEGCRYLSGKQAEPVDVLDAREEGFSPCGVCKPDDALAAAADRTAGQETEQETEPVAAEAPAQEEPVVEEDVPGVEVPAARKAPAKKAAKKAPAKKTPAKKAFSRAVATTAATTAAAPAGSKPPGKAASKAASKAPSKAATAAAAASPAAVSARAKPGSVVAVPERGRYHRSECRYVRDVDGEVMTKTAANRAGMAACGVCKP